MGARESIVEAIRADGPIRFDRYMELSLYGAGGFYDDPPVGAAGDFVTSPHVHPIFAELLATAVADLRGTLDGPPPFRVTEVGAGDGRLARELVPHLSFPVSYVAIERSAGSRRALAGIDGIGVAEELEGSPQLVIANELLDNLPFRRLVGTASGPAEVFVGLDGDRLVERLEPLAPEGPALAKGQERIVPEGAFAFVDELAARLAHPGYALLIDYGGVGEPGGPAHGYRAHRLVEDLLDRPGTADITAGVDFALIAERAERNGLVAFGPVTQRNALTSLGFDRWIREELRRQARHLVERRGLDAVRTWSGRSRATLLVDPTGLGRLRWLLLGSPGLPAPPWM